jgi:hypothetical protein
LGKPTPIGAITVATLTGSWGIARPQRVEVAVAATDDTDHQPLDPPP